MCNQQTRRWVVALGIWSAVPFAWAEDEAMLAPVVVSGSRDPDGPTLTQPNLRVAKERIGQTPGGVGIVDTEAVEEGRLATVADNFRYAAGVFAQSRFGAEEARLSIRGSGIQRTFHLRGIQLMLDGVPLNHADGSGDFQSLEPLATRYTEVYRGANALQYGATTLGGAINYVSRTGYDAAPLGLRAEAGSFGYLRSQLSGGAVQGNADYYASFTTYDQRGFRRHAVQAGRRLNANLGYRIGEDVETRFYLAWASSDSELPGNLTREQIKRAPRRAHPSNVAGDYRRDVDVWRVANRTVWRIGEGRFEAVLHYASEEMFHPIFQVLEQDGYTAGGELRYVSEAHLAGRPNRFVAGYAYLRGVTDEGRFRNVAGRRGDRTDRSRQFATSHVFYVENAHYVLADLALVLGAQHTRAVRDRNDKFGADDGYEQSYTGINPKYGVLYRLAPRVQLFANASKSFEPPSFSEGLVQGTPNRAQKGWTYEVGTRGETGAVYWDVALYHARLRNELLTIGTGPSSPAETVNVPRTVHEGVEAAIGGRFSRLEWQSVALLNRFRFEDHSLYGDNTLPGLPKLLLRGELLYRGANGFYAGPNVEWSPRKYPVDMANSLHADPYVVWGFKLGQDSNRRWSWFIDVRNVFDKRYSATTGVIRDAQAPDPNLDLAQFLPGDGRSVYLGLQWRM